MMGINVRATRETRYALEIVTGAKTLETRATDSLRPYVGRRVGIVETGRGPAHLVGFVTIGEPIQANAGRAFDRLAGGHLVRPGCPFYPSEGVKFCYPMLNPEPCAPRAIESRGIIARRIDEPM